MRGRRRGPEFLVEGGGGPELPRQIGTAGRAAAADPQLLSATQNRTPREKFQEGHRQIPLCAPLVLSSWTMKAPQREGGTIVPRTWIVPPCRRSALPYAQSNPDVRSTFSATHKTATANHHPTIAILSQVVKRFNTNLVNFDIETVPTKWAVRERDHDARADQALSGSPRRPTSGRRRQRDLSKRRRIFVSNSGRRRLRKGISMRSPCRGAGAFGRPANSKTHVVQSRAVRDRNHALQSRFWLSAGALRARRAPKRSWAHVVRAPCGTAGRWQLAKRTNSVGRPERPRIAFHRVATAAPARALGAVQRGLP